jgi:DNA transformation protein
MDRIRDLPGLARKSEEALARVSIYTVEDLRTIGPVMAFYRLRMLAREVGKSGPSLNFLYALVGALSGISWLEVAHTQREQLLAELDSLEQMERLFA